MIGSLQSGYWLISCVAAIMVVAACERSPPAPGPGAPLYYRSPMDPSVTSPVPAKDSMGMDYLPVYAGEHKDVTVPADVVRTLGVRTEPVVRGVLPGQVRALGVTQYDDRAIQEVRVRGEGWVERFPRLGVGDRVRPGQLLFEMYSLRLEAAEQEYLNSLAYGDAARLELSATRLRNLGVDEELIHSLKETRKVPHLIPFHAGIGGVLTEVAVHTGAYVLPETVLFRIAPTDPLTVIFEVPQSSGHSIAVGDEVTMSLEDDSGHDLVGKVDTVYPQIEPETRSVKLRVLIPNPRDELRANMYVSGLIRTGTGRAPRREVLHVPREAVIRGGTSDRLIVALGNGRFVPRVVTVGDESGDRVAVLSGVSEGERVVTTGLFLLDSETNLRSAPGPGP